MIGRDARINLLISTGHFMSHYYHLCLPPMFIAWQGEFGVSFAELGLAMALMSGTTAVAQAPVGFLVDRYGARPFPDRRHQPDDLVDRGGAMGFATAFWQIALLWRCCRGSAIRSFTRPTIRSSAGRSTAGPASAARSRCIRIKSGMSASPPHRRSPPL